jgi:polar amino acid transport system substrate-binding protein
VQTIVADLKDFARQQPSDLNEMVDINRSVERAAGLAGNLIQKSTRDFAMDLTPDLPPVQGNAQRLEQVLVNLLVNACQALTSADEPIRIATGTDSASGQIRVTVTDGGSGIPEDRLQRIKDPFFTTKRDRGGTGLGLAVSDRIVQDHGGRLEFSAALPQGTEAAVVLPTKASSEKDRP